MTKEELEKKRDELATLEANYFANIQFPPTWVETSKEGLKQDVNVARRIRCHDDHKWGFQKGFNECMNLLLPRLEEAEKVIEFYADMDSWETSDNHKTYATIDKSDLGEGDFEQSTGPNHVLNSVSDMNNGGKRARQYLEKKND